MELKFILGIFFIITGVIEVQSQNISKQHVLNRFGFEEHSIITEDDTIFFYTHIKNSVKPKRLVLHLQGTSPDPLFSIEKEKENMVSYRWFPKDYQLLDSSYCYVVIAKTGIEPILKENTRNDIKKYQTFNSLDNRVFRADTVINYISEKLYPNLEKVIVYGHSEGAPVAAKLATVNDKITHLGYWAGNALPDFFDFIIFNTKAIDKGKLSREEAFTNINEILSEFEQIAENKTDVSFESKDDYTNKRWWSYSEPPIYNLLKLEIPIFMQVAGNDKSAPIESTFLVPLEFTRTEKSNLTYKICVECDHGFTIENDEGKTDDKWSEIFVDFIKWTEKNAR